MNRSSRRSSIPRGGRLSCPHGATPPRSGPRPVSWWSAPRGPTPGHAMMGRHRGRSHAHCHTAAQSLRCNTSTSYLRALSDAAAPVVPTAILQRSSICLWRMNHTHRGRARSRAVWTFGAGRIQALPTGPGASTRTRWILSPYPLVRVNHRYALMTMIPATGRPARAPPSPLGQRGILGHGRPRLNPPASSSAAMRAAIGGCVWNIPPRLPSSPRPFTNGDSMYRCAVARPTCLI